VQDKASCLAVEVADPKPSELVLDVCAAPGAKTTYMAQLMQNQGTVYSVDYSRRRIREWKNEAKRMGVTNSAAVVADAQKPLPMNVVADLVVLDPPCTSTGAFGKTPSAKWRLTKRSMFNMLLTGRYDFLDFLIIPHSRDSIVSLYGTLLEVQELDPNLKFPVLYLFETLHTRSFLTAIALASMLLSTVLCTSFRSISMPCSCAT
jgi:SAM-dependent methyltransferase